MNKERLTIMYEIPANTAVEIAENIQPDAQPGYIVGKYFIVQQSINQESFKVIMAGRIKEYLGNSSYFVEMLNRESLNKGAKIATITRMMALNFIFLSEEEFKNKVRYAYDLD